MLDALKRLGIMGVGVISKAEDEIQTVITDLRHKGELSEEEGQKVLTDWRERVALNQREVKELVGKAVQDAIQAAGSPSREEFNAMVSRVEALESRLSQEQG